MPVRKVAGGYKWGKSGKVYPTEAKAERQGRAIYASGYQDGGITEVNQDDDPGIASRIAAFLRNVGRGREEPQWKVNLREKVARGEADPALLTMGIDPLDKAGMFEAAYGPGASKAQTLWAAGLFSGLGGVAEAGGIYPEPPSREASIYEMLTGPRTPGVKEHWQTGHPWIASLQTVGAVFPGVNYVRAASRPVREGIALLEGNVARFAEPGGSFQRRLLGDYAAAHLGRPLDVDDASRLGFLTGMEQPTTLAGQGTRAARAADSPDDVVVAARGDDREAYLASQQPRKKIKGKPKDHPTRLLRQEIREIRHARAQNRPPTGVGRSLEQRLQAFKLKNRANELVTNHPNSSHWYKPEKDQIFQAVSLNYNPDRSLRRANLKGLVRKFKAEGWVVDHVSKEKGRVSSYYVTKGDNRVRISSHDLPMTAEREANRAIGLSGSWGDEIIVGPQTNIEQAYRSVLGDEGIGALLPAQKSREAAAAARLREAQTTPTRRLGTTGQYVGAPRGVTSPQALGRLRSNYIDMVRAGEAGKEWYTDASNWVQGATNNPQQAQQLADQLAVTSAGTNVGSNLGFTVKGLNQAAAGAPVQTGRFPTRQSAQIEAIQGGSRESLGPKITPFADNLSVAWNPRMASQPVHDIWQGRAMGYKDVSVKSYPTRREALDSITNKRGEVSAAAEIIKDGDVYRIERPWSAGFSDAQHAFMDREMATIVNILNEGKVAGKTDWTPSEAQAAAWTGAKISSGELKPADAAKHYGSFSSRYTAHATTEQAPGIGTGHLEGFSELPQGQREAFALDPRSSWTDQAGRDELYASMGIPVEPSLENVGSYRTVAGGELETNPGVVARPLVQTESAAPRKGQLTPEGRTVLEKGESARAYFDVQNAGAAHYLIPDSQTRAGERISLNIPLNRKLTYEEMVALDEVAQNNGMFVVDSGKGVRMINDPYSEIGASRAEAASATGAASRAEAAKNLNKERKGEGGLYDQVINSIDEPADSVRVIPTKIETVYEDYQGLWSQGVGSGASTSKILDDMDQVPVIRDAMEPPLKRKAQQNLVRDQEMAESSGLAVRSDVQEARRIFIAEGFAGLREALNNGAILPAVVAAVVAPAVLIERNESQQM